jgi:folate-binding protein YgfZ
MNVAPQAPLAWIGDYDALVERAALVPLEQRTQIELTGADRASFLHNLCTNEIRQLTPGSGCEAFLTTAQGRTLAHLFAFVGPESIVISTVAGQAEIIMAHLDHYLVSEQVTLADRSQSWSEWYLGGPHSADVVSQTIADRPPAVRLEHRSTTIAGKSAWVRRADLTHPDGFLIAAARDEIAAIANAIESLDVPRISLEAFEAARIEHRSPLYGRDITDKNLPQEVGRNPLAISFKKGCYLGQETVARIDALGHVNQSLVAVKFDGTTVPVAGALLTADRQTVGHVTSAAFSPRFGRPIALAYVRRGHLASGTPLESTVGRAEVVGPLN